jgi:two-component system cell cycle response regulator DivK
VTAGSPAPREDLLVLIVDDDERNLRLARDVLRAHGLRTVEAATGSEAIDRAARELPDVILLDLGLPDIDGASVVRALGARESTTRIPVVAFTALPQAGDWFREAGFAGYLEKPFDIDELAARVRAFCAPSEG